MGRLIPTKDHRARPGGIIGWLIAVIALILAGTERRACSRAEQSADSCAFERATTLISNDGPEDAATYCAHDSPMIFIGPSIRTNTGCCRQHESKSGSESSET
jgi:hypothetical protein